MRIPESIAGQELEGRGGQPGEGCASGVPSGLQEPLAGGEFSGGRRAELLWPSLAV